MTRPRRQKDETTRLAPLRKDPPGVRGAGPTFDQVTRLARELFHTEMAALSLAEDQHYALTHPRAGAWSEDVARAPGAGSPFEVLNEFGGLLEREIQSFEASSIDALTGLTNRSGLLTLGEEMLSISLSADEGAALLFIGLEGVPRIRDRFGAKAGDQALRDLARILEGNFRGSDLVARLGGDEFSVLMTPYSDQTDDFTAAARLDAAITRYNESGDVPWALRISVGGARCLPGMGLDRLLSLADERMIDARARMRALRE